MVLGLSLFNFTLLHTLISFFAIATGFMVLGGLVMNRHSGCWTAIFLLLTVLVTVTGFLFPLQQPFPSPAFITGVISSILLVVALFALYGKHLAGSWRAICVVTAVAANWFDSFVLVVQTFDKVAVLKALPVPSMPFLIAQALTLGIHVLIAFIALRRFQPMAA
jgi:hypothetical protein